MNWCFYAADPGIVTAMVTHERLPDPRDAGIHRALSSPVRSQLLEHLQASDAPVGIAALAERLQLHVNTVRAHVGVLEEAGLVTSEPEARDTPGRPRLVYRATPRGEAVSTTSEDGYRFLATVLASYLSASATDPARAAEDAGAAWGHYVVERPAPFDTMTADDGIGRIVALLDEMGFAPQLDGADAGTPRIRLRRCPFLDVARDHQDVVCSVHLGLMRGALDELGVQVEALALRPFVEPGLCVADLQVEA